MKYLNKIFPEIGLFVFFLGFFFAPFFFNVVFADVVDHCVYGGSVTSLSSDFEANTSNSETGTLITTAINLSGTGRIEQDGSSDSSYDFSDFTSDCLSYDNFQIPMVSVASDHSALYIGFDTYPLSIDIGSEYAFDYLNLTNFGTSLLYFNLDNGYGLRGVDSSANLSDGLWFINYHLSGSSHIGNPIPFYVVGGLFYLSPPDIASTTSSSVFLSALDEQYMWAILLFFIASYWFYYFMCEFLLKKNLKIDIK